MSSTEFLKISGYAEVAFCVAALCLLIFRGQWRRYWALGTFLLVRASTGILFALILRRSHDHAYRQLAYQTYFYVYWSAYAVETVLTLFILYGVFRLTLTPLQGLRRFCGRIFCAIAILCAAITAFAPFGRTQPSGMTAMSASISQLQRMQSILTLCLVVFVLAVARAIGLSYRSTVVGVTLGLGNLAALNLLLSFRLALHLENYVQYAAWNAVAVAAVFGLWAVYLALPQRPSQPVELPVNSLLARWNSTCLAWTEGA